MFDVHPTTDNSISPPPMRNFFTSFGSPLPFPDVVENIRSVFMCNFQMLINNFFFFYFGACLNVSCRVHFRSCFMSTTCESSAMVQTKLGSTLKNWQGMFNSFRQHNKHSDLSHTLVTISGFLTDSSGLVNLPPPLDISVQVMKSPALSPVGSIDAQTP